MKRLTTREDEVMRLLVLGHLRKDIALRLHISIKTVEKHKQAVYYKWRVDSILALARLALRADHVRYEDFLHSKIGENRHHEIPQNCERKTTYV